MTSPTSVVVSRPLASAPVIVLNYRVQTCWSSRSDLAHEFTRLTVSAETPDRAESLLTSVLVQGKHLRLFVAQSQKLSL